MSCSAVTVTVCAVFQSAAVKRRDAGDTVTSALAEVTATVTGAVGSVASATVQVPVSPSRTVSAVRDTTRPAASASTIVTGRLTSATEP